MKFNTNLKRWIAGMIVLCHAGVLAVPAMAAVEQEAFGRAKPGTEGSVSQSDLGRLQELVKQMQMRLKDLTPTAKLSASKTQELNKQKQALQIKSAQQILDLRSGIASETVKAVADLRAEAKLFKDKTIAQRQEQTAQLIEQRQTIMDSLFNQLADAKDDTSRNVALAKITQQMAAWEPKKLQRDFKELPWGRPDSKVPAPVTAQDFKKLAASLEHYQVKSNEKLKINPLYKSHQDLSGLSPDELWKQATPTVLTTSSVGQWQKIAFNGMTLSDQNKWPVLASLPVTTQAEDLKANEDVQITQEIKDLAQQLDHNPTKIYKWVYDNIEFVPTYGSIQGSAYTLETKRGNATDTSSLLIALLRASGIPARYVSGTIDVPAEVAKDWVGGVNNLSAAGNLIGQGGVPSVIVMNGGKESHLRMEHIWVEAKMDFIPSKGAVQISGQNNPNIEDSWVPLDASYKRYERTKGIDLAKAVPFDAEGILNKAKQGATVDESNGSVQNLNAANIETATKAYQDKVEAYLKQQHPTATVGDVLGTSKIKTYKSKMLSPVLPYEVVAVVRDYHTLPDTMRHYFHLNMYIAPNAMNVSMGEDIEHSFKIPSTQLQGKSLALSFRPSTEADSNALANLIPKSNVNSSIDPIQLPKSLSSSIKLTGEITLNGQILKTLSSYALGTELKAQMGFQSPRGMRLANKEFTAGEYHAIGYNLQGISENNLDQLQINLSETKKMINDNVGMKLLNRHDLTGSILQYSVYSYFHLNDLQTQILSKKFGVISQPFMSFGTFSTGLQSGYSWGILRNAKFSGMVMDIDHIASIQVDSNNNNQNWLSFNKQQGIAQSLNENLVPEMLLRESKTVNSTQGISAIKALQIAHDKGQKIYQIDHSNINNILPMLSHENQVITDIRNAVNAGKIVTTSQSSVILNGWNGSGYIILDPYTGSGAYMISGGLNGGFTTLTDGHGNSFSLAGMVPSLDFLESETLSKSLAYTKNIFEIYIGQAQAFLNCNKEVILNFIVTIAIVLAILVAASATAASGGTSSPATVPFMVVLAAMIPATANAGKGNSNQNENCVDDSCKTAQKVHLKAINVLGKEHNYKDSYGATPNRFYDICACNKGAITIVEGAGQCGKVSNFFTVTYERWKDPIITWDGN